MKTLKQNKAILEAHSRRFEALPGRTRTNNPHLSQRQQIIRNLASKLSLNELHRLRDEAEKQRWSGPIILLINLTIQVK